MGTWLCRCATARPPTRSLHGGGARNARHGVGGPGGPPAAAGDRDQGRWKARAARRPAAGAAAPRPAGRPGLPLWRAAPAALRRPRAGTGAVVPGQGDHSGGSRAAGRGLSALVGAVPLIRAEHGGRDLGSHALVRGRAGLRLPARRTAAGAMVALPRPAAAPAGRAALADPAAA